MTPRGDDKYEDQDLDDEDEDEDEEGYDEDYDGDEAEEAEIQVERVSFDRSNIPVESAKATKAQLLKQAQRKRERAEHSKRRRFIRRKVIPSALGVVVFVLLGGAALKLYLKERLAAEGAPVGEAGGATTAGGTADQAETAQKAIAREQFLGREAMPLGDSGEAIAPSAAADDPGELVAKYLEAARQLTNEGKFPQARKLLEKAVLLAPETADLYLLYGTSYVNEDPGKARANAVRALQLDPRSPGGLKLLGLAYQAQRNAGVVSGDEVTLLEMEVRDYEEVLEKSPDWPELIFACASQRLRLFRLAPDRKQDLEETIRQLEQVLSLWKKTVNATELAATHHQLGRALKYKADALAAADRAAADTLYERAIAEQSQSLELDPNRFDSLGQLILVYRVRDEMEKALATTQAHLPKIEHDAVRARVHEMLGGLHLESGQESEAVAAFEVALKLSAKLPNSYLALAKLHWEKQDAEQTENMLMRGVAAIPNFLDAQCQLGLFYVEHGSPQQAIAILEQAIRIPPQKAVLVNSVPSRNAARNRYYYQAASALAALYLEAQENTSEARYAAAFAQQFGIADIRLRDTMGWIHYKDEEYDKAAAILEPLAAGPNTFPALQYHLAAVYAKQGKYAEARQALEVALAAAEDFPGRAEAEALREELRAQ